MGDDLRQRYSQLLDGTYDCVDRIVLNAYNRFCYSAGGFREWWRRLMNGSDEQLDNAHLMRMAGRFSRRVRGFAKAHQIPVIDCRRGQRKHDLAEDYLATHTVNAHSQRPDVGSVAAAVPPGEDACWWNRPQQPTYANHADRAPYSQPVTQRLQSERVASQSSLDDRPTRLHEA